jgi:endonuclease YncB( thermonuclease family)
MSKKISARSVWGVVNLVVLITLGSIIAYRQHAAPAIAPNAIFPTADVPSEAKLGNATSTSATVARGIDGDTIELETGQKVRYIGIDTPETVDPRKTVQCFGKEASAFNKQLVEGQTVQLVKDVSDTDRYHRLLRYVYLQDGTFVNLKLVQEGYANVDTFPPDVKFADIFKEAAAQAKLAKKGLWAKCK